MRTVVTFALFMIGFIQISCNRCDDSSPKHEAFLSECEQLSIPYNGDEELRFLSNGDTIKLKGNGVQWTTEMGFSSGGDCGDAYKQAVKNYHYSNDTFSLIIRLIPGAFNVPTSLEISKKINSGWIETMIVEYCSDSPILKFGDKTYFDQPEDSIQLLNKMYYEVYTAFAPGFYYNLSDGILKFTDRGYVDGGPNYYRAYERIP